MENVLMSLASKEGLFAVMFVALFLYQILDSRKREERLMNFIDNISSQFESLAKQYEKLADDVDEIRQDMKDFFKR
ncbi:BhlA/UviB family holin-like peptide [Neobacillus rhizosphaerae]|uniref:BhlA/UviB family holin-like peptide n=1 Tax=Neobacillus rhizosphaerae TaxID=2880965 RepID=UPI003D2CC80C